MSTHNIGFYEDLTKIIFELSSNIIKYAPYFFCCKYMSSVKRKTVFWVSDQVLHKLGCTASQPQKKSKNMQRSGTEAIKTQI